MDEFQYQETFIDHPKFADDELLKYTTEELLDNFKTYITSFISKK